MVNAKVHRCQFTNWRPAAIKCIAVSTHINGFPNMQNSNNNAKEKVLLAIGRVHTNDIEIWDVDAQTGAMAPILRIPGREGTSVEQLIWVQNKSSEATNKELRLFSCGLQGQIIEWDLLTLSSKQIIDAVGGGAWSFCANPEGSILAAACEDGRVRLYDTDTLELHSVLTITSGRRVLSVAFDHTGENLFSGDAVGNIHCHTNPAVRPSEQPGAYKARFNTHKFDIKLPARSRGERHVWKLLVLSDNTIVAGTASGYTTFCDGNSGVVVQSFTHHLADVLTIVANEKEDAVYASGADGTIVMFQRIHKDKADAWVYGSLLRPHDHDIFALAILNGKLLSGGIDTRLMTTPLKFFHVNKNPRLQENILHQYPVNKQASITTVRGRNYLVSTEPHSVQIWNLPTSDQDELAAIESAKNGDTIPVGVAPGCLLSVNKKINQYNISDSAMSADGNWLAYTSVTEVRLMRIRIDDDENSITVEQDMHIEKKNDLVKPGHFVAFSEDSTKLIVAALDNTIQVLSLEDPENIKLAAKFDHNLTDQTPADMMDVDEAVVATTTAAATPAADDNKKSKKKNKYLTKRFIQRLDSTNDILRLPTLVSLETRGKYLIASSLNNTIHVFDLSTLKHYWRIASSDIRYNPRVSISPDAKYAAVYSGYVTCVCDLDAQKIIATTKTNAKSEGIVRRVEFLPINNNNNNSNANTLIASLLILTYMGLFATSLTATTSTTTTKEGEDQLQVIKKLAKLKPLKGYEAAFEVLAAAAGSAAAECAVVEKPWELIFSRLPGMVFRSVAFSS